MLFGWDAKLQSLVPVIWYVSPLQSTHHSEDLWSLLLALVHKNITYKAPSDLKSHANDKAKFWVLAHKLEFEPRTTVPQWNIGVRVRIGFICPLMFHEFKYNKPTTLMKISNKVHTHCCYVGLYVCIRVPICWALNHQHLHIYTNIHENSEF